MRTTESSMRFQGGQYAEGRWEPADFQLIQIILAGWSR
jgi:hypothetical protein